MTNKLTLGLTMITGALRLATGFSEVREEKGEIIISGVSAENLARDMKKIWTTSKIASAMFTKVTWTEVRLPSFFALELDYILRRLIDARGMQSSKRVLRNILDGINTNTWVARLSVPTSPWMDHKAYQGTYIFDDLLPHQQEFIDLYERTVPKYGLRGMLLAVPPGGGKSITDTSLALAVKADVVIIVCPKNASLRVWQKTLNEEFKVPQHPYVAELDGAIQPKKKWHVFHYEALDRAVELAKTVRDKNVCVILDESHHFNDSKSLRTERFLQVCKITNAQNIVFASGTPIKAMGYEAIPLLRAIDPLFTPVVEEAFRKMYGRDAKRTLDILAYRLGLVTHSVPKDRFMSDKPEIEPIYVKMPNSDQYTLAHLSKVMDEFIKDRTAFYNMNKRQYVEIYEECVEIHRQTLKTKQQLEEFSQYRAIVAYMAKNGFDSRFDGDNAVITNKYEKDKILPTLPQDKRKAFVDAKSVVKYVDLKVRGECLGRILTKERIQCHVDMLQHIDFDYLIGSIKKKTLIFTSYVRIVDECVKLLRTKKYNPLIVYGETNNELPSIVKKFGDDKTANPLVTTYMSLSTAVPLVMANGIIFLNSPWRSYERDQAIARAWRIGQDEPVYCFEIVLDTGKVANISSRSLDIMQWSKEQVDQIMGIQGDANVSLESNGFIIPMKMDYNEVLDDVLYDPEQESVDALPIAEYVKSTQVGSVEQYYPHDYLFYSQKKK